MIIPTCFVETPSGRRYFAWVDGKLYQRMPVNGDAERFSDVGGDRCLRIVSAHAISSGVTIFDPPFHSDNQARHRMSAEDHAAQPLTPEMIEVILRVARETAREEVRAAFDARKPGVVDARSAAERARDYDALLTMDGVPL